MGNNPYKQNKNKVSQQIPQNQAYNYNPVIYRNQPPGVQQAVRSQQAQSQQTQTPARMPKARALELVSYFKRGLVLTSLAAFASFSGLVAYHQITAPGQKSSTSTTSSSSQQQNNTFFHQQGDDNLGTSTPTDTSNGSDDTSNSNTGPSSGTGIGFPSGPVSGSHTS